MKLNYLIVVILMLAMCLHACNDDDDDSGPADEPDPEPEQINFGGITHTDEDGFIIEKDSTDWQFYDEWTDLELELFDGNDYEHCSVEKDAFVIIGYPNPANFLFNLYLEKPEGYLLSYRITDRYYETLTGQDSLDMGSLIAIDTEVLNISEDTVRMYYRLLGDDCILNGHGDIKIQ